MEHEGVGGPGIEGERWVRHAPVATGRRRPSGQPPPLPRELGKTGRFWLFMVAYFVTVVLGVLFFAPFARLFERFDTNRLHWMVNLRTPWLTRGALWVNILAAHWTIRILRYGTIIGLIAFRRWRHLVIFLGTVIALELMTYQFSLFLTRPRPLDVRILAGWDGFSMPSRPAASLAVTLIAIAYTMVVPGRPRYQAKWALGVVLVLVVLARVYLAVDAPTAAAFGAILGIAFGVTAFRWFTPNDIFPVSYRRGKSAHLDVTGRRGEAITKAVSEQLGYQILEAKPVGLAGSGGSTPLRLRVAASGEEPEHYLFAKLYAKSHVRADRWYKLGRAILYGALEDETPFQTVRRFVEYEDYALRLLYDMGLPVPRPFGIVEITPEREYMIVMEFFDDAVEISEAEIDARVIDEGLQMIRTMWDQGIAHRDIKPANLMVQLGELRLIDVFFVQVRPSPWRQAVDLANMMMVLGLRSDANTVYAAALRFFTEDEIAEAFAATRGVASPTQLRSMMKEQGRDLLAEFRSLAPARPPIAIQRWSIRRVILTLSVLFGLFLVFGLIVSNWTAFA
jgi:tRNA A-37 threonylcarbamoyl transferase component Bud32